MFVTFADRVRSPEGFAAIQFVVDAQVPVIHRQASLTLIISQIQMSRQLRMVLPQLLISISREGETLVRAAPNCPQ